MTTAQIAHAATILAAALGVGVVGATVVCAAIVVHALRAEQRTEGRQ